MYATKHKAIMNDHFHMFHVSQTMQTLYRVMHILQNKSLINASCLIFDFDTNDYIDKFTCTALDVITQVGRNLRINYAPGPENFRDFTLKDLGSHRKSPGKVIQCFTRGRVWACRLEGGHSCSDILGIKRQSLKLSGMVILIVVEIWFCTGVGTCVLEAEMLVRKKRERSKKHKSKRCHCYAVIDIIKNLKSYKNSKSADDHKPTTDSWWSPVGALNLRPAIPDIVKSNKQSNKIVRSVIRIKTCAGVTLV